jgi:hypothetical protein
LITSCPWWCDSEIFHWQCCDIPIS